MDISILQKEMRTSEYHVLVGFSCSYAPHCPNIREQKGIQIKFRARFERTTCRYFYKLQSAALPLSYRNSVLIIA